MTRTLVQLQPAAAQSLSLWHNMLSRQDLSNLASIVHPDAIFRSPMVYAPYVSARAVMLVLNTAIRVFEDFIYHRELASEDGLSVVLEFSARVGDKNLKGIDLIRFDEQGLIVEFEVMVRPFSGLQALGAAMSARLGDQLLSLKG
jgi:hypothetical protein